MTSNTSSVGCQRTTTRGAGSCRCLRSWSRQSRPIPASMRCCRRSFTLTDARVIDGINGLRVETPSWGYGNSGTRFKVFAQPGAARTIEEKLADAGMVNRLTGICPTVAIHIPWDRVDDWDALRNVAAGQGLKIGAINPNLFQDDEYMLGSLTHPSAAVRGQAIGHALECIEIARRVGSSILSLWLADGTNYPGQDDLRSRSKRLREGLRQVYAGLPSGIRLLVGYKFFELGF